MSPTIADTHVGEEATTPNVPLLIETLAHIQACPEEWTQGHWRCGTAACYAGRAALLNGAQWALEPGMHSAFMPVGAVRMNWDGQILAEENGSLYHDDVTWVDEDGQRIYQHVAAYARRALGLPGWIASDLFQASNSLDDIERAVARLTSPAPEPSI